ncbi:MAG: 50S ribosomal protein L19 [Candidatus Marinimicrobia bacterium]|nr:50S ribosomal protein L19 [Candidatus Neomarinimicrobiota bacterium]
MDRIYNATKDQLRENIPDFRPGDSLTVTIKITEGEKTRPQEFKGICIARKGSGLNSTFMVRKISNGVGVERIFPLHSPKIISIKKNSSGNVKRSKLYYIRKLKGKKATKVKELKRK